MNNTNVVIKKGNELSEQEIKRINEAKAREWKTPPLDDLQKKEIFVLVMDENGTILAQGQLVAIDGITFDGETFNIFGIGGIIANIRGEGYGRQLVKAINEYLLAKNKIGIGFTGVPEFYRKCGFKTDKDSLKRFVHLVDSKKVTNTIDECLVYFDSADQFMKKVLEHSDKEIYLPRDPDW